MVMRVTLGKVYSHKQVALPQMNSQSSKVLDHLVLKDLLYLIRSLPRSVRTKCDVQTRHIRELQL